MKSTTIVARILLISLFSVLAFAAMQAATAQTTTPASEPAAPAASAPVPAPPSAETNQAPQATEIPTNIGDYYGRGGWVMHPILLCSIIAASIAIERVYHFKRARTDHRRLLADIKALLADDLIYKAMARCDEDRGPVAHVLKAVLKNMDKDGDTIRDAVDVAGLEEIPRLERHLYALATIANVSTLLGLLGTILGMIQTFAAIAATTTGVVNVHILSSGIWTAMLTTAFGLMVAIPTTLVHAYLGNEVKKFSIAMEHSSAELVHYLQHQPSKGDEI